jgi:DNA repair protein RadC|tara:strand:+ start:378 stop:818 length:441 start_codon:yes stop_codon:yes gene_type:complete
MKKTEIAEVQPKYKRKNMSGVPSIHSSKDCNEILRVFFTDVTYKEQFFIMLLDRANNVLGVSKVSEGGCAGTVVDGKIIFQTALISNAQAIILCHNHPSGQLFPSTSDLNLTDKIRMFGGYIDIKVLDHLIITRDGFYSFADNGKM